MEDKLLGYMQWPEIEAIIYSEHDRPKQILGPHKVDEGILYRLSSQEQKSVRFL